MIHDSNRQYTVSCYLFNTHSDRFEQMLGPSNGGEIEFSAEIAKVISDRSRQLIVPVLIIIWDSLEYTL